MQRARAWVNKNGCGLPLDLTVELLGAGLDARTIECQLIEEREDD